MRKWSMFLSNHGLHESIKKVTLGIDDTLDQLRFNLTKEINLLEHDKLKLKFSLEKIPVLLSDLS